MSLLPKSLLAFGLLLASVLVPSGTALAANNSELQTLIRNCEAQNGKDCTELGRMYFSSSGIGVQQDLEKAAEYYTKGCDLQDTFACEDLEWFYIGQGVDKDYAKAAEYYAKGCDLQDTFACEGLEWFYIGQGVDKDYAKAAEYYAKRCDLQDGYACWLLGMLYYNGRDYARATEYYTKGCELQNKLACEGLERSYSGNQDVTNVAQKYKQACDLNVAASCIDLASLYERGQGVEQNDAKAAEYYAKGTELMTPEERQKFFSERLEQNKADHTQQHEQIQQMQDEIETLRSFSLESESNRNILQIQGNTN